MNKSEYDLFITKICTTLKKDYNKNAITETGTLVYVLRDTQMDNKNKIKLAKCLLEIGFDPNEQIDDKGQTPLMIAVSMVRDYDLIKLMLEKGADPNKQGKFKATALHLVDSRDPKIIELLLKYNANPLIKDKFGETPRQAMEKLYPEDKESIELLKNAEKEWALKN